MKPSIIPNWKYQKPSKGGYKGLKKLLKYVSYRESPDHRPVDLSDRWTDCGVGSGWHEVYEKAGSLAGPYVLAHHMVISPAPDLMLLAPEAIRHEVVREVTERTIETWHIERGLAVPDWFRVNLRRNLHDTRTAFTGGYLRAVVNDGKIGLPEAVAATAFHTIAYKRA